MQEHVTAIQIMQEKTVLFTAPMETMYIMVFVEITRVVQKILSSTLKPKNVILGNLVLKDWLS